MNLTRDQKIDILLIGISIISIITGYISSHKYIAIIAVILCGIPIFKECIGGLTKEFDIKADLLVSIAIISSLIIGEIFAACEIALIMAIGGFLEEYTIRKTHKRIEELINITPQFATRIKNGFEEKIPAEEVIVGDILKILPGESIPTDGIIINGETSIDQSTLTGEPLPVDKKTNDKVFSGTINQHGSFTMQTTKASKDSSLQKLIRLVESSAPENAKIVRTADKWATMIVVIAFTASILTYLFTFKIIRSVTILVVFCPCAFVLATPTAIMATIGNLTKHGILVKNGESIEEMAHIDEVIFDKTGTLTYGKPEVTKVISDNPEEMMYLLASLESKSEHPLAKSILRYYNTNELAHVDNFKMEIGNGIKGKINGCEIRACNRKYVENEGIDLKYPEFPAYGEIEIFVVKDMNVIGKVLLSDTVRENMKDTIWTLKGMRIRTALLTGDNEKAANKIANQVKIRKVRAERLPEDKLKYIQEEQLKGNKLAMIGDGLNDAPSLKKANVGIVMSEIGSDISVEAADIALINDNIEDIPYIIAIAKKAIRTINMCISFALIINFIALTLAIMGMINPIEGALIHNIGSVLVVIYSMQLLRYRFPTRNTNKIELPPTFKKLGILDFLTYFN